ncbi:MAG: DUF6036 family nucleotidyltransferase [Acidimicrobiales bacterium]
MSWEPSPGVLGRADVFSLLDELAGILAERGLRGQLFLVGGAAMAVAYDSRRLTQDVDGVFEPKMAVYEAAKVVGERHDLPRDWLNDAVKGFLPGPDVEARVYFDQPGLSVQVASPRYLFILKAMAARQARDADDLRTLYPLTGFTSVAQALDAIERAYPGLAIAPRVAYFVQEVLAAPSAGGLDPPPAGPGP